MHNFLSLLSSELYKCLLKDKLILDHGCGEVVSKLAFYFDDPSLNPDEVYSFSVILGEEAGDGP